jgi:uncharacterized protein YjbI with pentapeptide repeats
VTLSVAEGGSNTFDVRLAAQPTANVTVTVAWTSGDADLSVTRLTGSVLRNAKLNRVNLRELDLRGIDLVGASLRNSNLAGVFLTNANMSDVDLKDATLDRVEMTGVDLRGANLEHIKYDQFTLYSLSKVKLDGAKMSENLKADLKSLSGSGS